MDKASQYELTVLNGSPILAFQLVELFDLVVVLVLCGHECEGIIFVGFSHYEDGNLNIE